MAENFSNLNKKGGEKTPHTQIQKTQRASNKMNPNKRTPRYIIIKMAKVKERILKAARKKQRIIYMGTSLRLLPDFSAKPLQDSWQ